MSGLVYVGEYQQRQWTVLDAWYHCGTRARLLAEVRSGLCTILVQNAIDNDSRIVCSSMAWKGHVTRIRVHPDDSLWPLRIPHDLPNLPKSHGTSCQLRCSVERKLFPIERSVALARLRLGKNPSTIFTSTGELSAFIATAPSNGHAER